jgi:Glyoxalase/Bleomycin resistance protein/Dioxygenase superfamily
VTTSNARSDVLGDRVQIAFVVTDLAGELPLWAEALGIGPFIQVDPFTVDAWYQGRPTTPTLTTAHTFVGDTQIAVLQQLDDAPTPYRDFLRGGRTGIEHLGFWPPDPGAAIRYLESRRRARIYEVRSPDGQVVPYYEGPEGMNTHIAILSRDPARDRVYDAIKQEVQRWDGSVPVRKYPSLSAFLAEHDAAAAEHHAIRPPSTTSSDPVM